MAEIFIHSLPNPDTSPDKSEAPLLLGSVCREWRHIAITMPALWTSLCIRWPSVTGVVRLTDLWLSRARGYPLAIQVYDVEEMETGNLEMFFETICRYSSQWRDVVLSIPLDALSRFRINGPLPLLEKLVVGSEISVFDEIQPITMFRDAPLLREVELVLDDVGTVKPSIIHLPWTQLTTFTGGLFNIQESLYVLSEATSLTECNFRDCLRGPTNFDIPPPLPLIKTLRLEGNFQRVRGGVLNYLTLPALEFLELQSSMRSTEYTVSVDFALVVLRSFLLRSSCPLREARLTTSKMALQALVECLSVMPTVEILELGRLSDVATFRRLHASSNLLPQLRCLSFTNPTILTIPYDDLIAMLFSRSNTSNNGGLARLERFTFTWTGFGIPFPDVQILDRFKVLVERGMHIHLGPPDASWV